MSKPTVFNFSYETKHVEEQLPVLVEEFSDEMLAAFDAKIACFTNTLEESTSSVRKGFDAKAHADKLLAHPVFQSNHMSYGVKSAQKRKEKGTFDSEKNQKMGQNLAKIGASRIGEKYNAAEQREVGKHLAAHIEDKIGHYPADVRNHMGHGRNPDADISGHGEGWDKIRKEEVNLEEGLHAEIKKHLDAGHKVTSGAVGRVGNIVDAESDHVRIKSPGRRGHAGTTFQAGDKVKIVKRSDTHYHVTNVMDEEVDLEEARSAAAEGRAAEHEFANQAPRPAFHGLSVKKVAEPTKHHVEVKGLLGKKRVASYSSAMAAASHAKRVGGNVVSEGYETDSEYLEEVKKLPDWAQSVFDEYKSKASKGAAMSDNSEVSKFNPKIDGKYKVQTFAKGKVNKGSYGTAVNAAEDEVPVKQKDAKFDVPNVWGNQAAPKAAPKAGKLVSFNDKSHKDTQSSAGAVHGPNSNHDVATVATPHNLTVQMVPGKGFAVVDSQGQVVTGKTGKELSGYRKKGAAQMALRDHMREDVDVVLSMSLSEMYQLFEEEQIDEAFRVVSDEAGYKVPHKSDRNTPERNQIAKEVRAARKPGDRIGTEKRLSGSGLTLSNQRESLDWVVEIIKENNIHRFFILDEADVIAEGTNFSLDGVVKSAYRKALQLEEYIADKVDQPARIMEIVKSTINK